MNLGQHFLAAAATTAFWPSWVAGLGLFGTALALFLVGRSRADLRKSQQRVASLLERADCILWEARVTKIDGELQWDLKTDPTGLLERLFPAADDPDRNCVWKAIVPADREARRARIRAALETGAPVYEHEFQVQHRSGLSWLHERAVISPAGAQQWNLVGIVVDVTERRRARERAQQAQAQIANIAAHADCVLWSADVAVRGEDIEWLRFEIPEESRGSRLFGSPAPDKTGLFWSRYDVPELPEMNARSRNAILSGANGYEQEFRVRSEKDTRWLREHASIFPTGPDEFHLVGVIVDISAKRAAEDALAAEKERLDVTLRAMADGVVATDGDGNVRYLNPAATAITEWEAIDAVDQPAAAVCVLQEEGTEKVLDLPLAGVIQGDAPAPLPERAVLHGRRGRTGLVEGSCAPLHNAEGAVIGTVIVFRDVTQRETLGRERQRRSRLESVGRLAGGIAHNFNNVLTVIAGNISAALLDIIDPEEARKALKEAEQAAVRARELTQQLLTFAKGGDPVRTVVPLPELLVDAARFALRNFRTKVVFDLPDDLWPVDADRDQIAQVVQQIVRNAAEATADDGTITVSARNEMTAATDERTDGHTNFVNISIKDDGPGIAPDQQARIFDPYYTSKDRRSGLGLATVYSIVQKHHGQVRVDSSPGAGATFHVRLPAASRTGASKEPRLSEATATSNRRVLFMDDEPAIGRMAAGILRRLGLAVTVVHDGEEAVAACRSAHEEGHRFDLLIMDLTVPGGMGGLEALERIRVFDPQAKAIVSSGYSEDPVLANFADYGFAERIAKPYRFIDFVNVVRKTLEIEPPAV